MRQNRIDFSMQPFNSIQKLILILLLALISTHAYADCITNRDGEVMCGKGSCERDRKGEVLCTGLGGGIVEDDNGDLYCGTGECVLDRKGDAWCSQVQGGGAATDNRGKAKCYGGCEKGEQKRCVPGT
jgi:hypothetical protein